MNRGIFPALLFSLHGLSAEAQPLSQKSPESILGVYHVAIHMDCTKIKSPLCDYEEGVKYNPDGTFEWMIAQNNRFTSKKTGRYVFRNDTVFHSQVVMHAFANADCQNKADCREIEKLKEKGDLLNAKFRKNGEPFTSVVKLLGDGTYQMTIKGRKTVIYRKIQEG